MHRQFARTSVICRLTILPESITKPLSLLTEDVFTSYGVTSAKDLRVTRAERVYI